MNLHVFPLKGTLRAYSFEKLRADFKAALSVAMLDFPQAMAYALVAGLPIQTGLLTSIIGSLLNPFFASSRFVMLGPTNSTAVLLLSSFLAIDLPKANYLAATGMILFMVAVLIITASMLKLVGLLRFVSRSVILGYSTASALLIIINQVSKTCGYSIPAASTFTEVLRYTIQYIQQLDLTTLFLSLCTITSYFIIKRSYKQLPVVPTTLFLMIIVAFILNIAGFELDMLTAITSTTSYFSFPEFNLPLFVQLSQPAFAIAFLIILESFNATKAMAAQGESVDINQQVFSVGICNMVSCFSSGMMVSASLTRSTLNLTGGSRTICSSWISGLLLLISIVALGPLLRFVPRAALSSIILIVGFSIISLSQINIIVRSTKSDATVFFLTLICGLIFRLETAIYIGAAASIVLFLKKASIPQLIEFDFNEEGELAQKTQGKIKVLPEISIVHVEGDLFFGSTDIFLDQARLIYADENLKIIILRMQNAHCIDATSAIAIADLAQFAKQKGRLLIISGALPEVQTVLTSSGLLNLIGPENVFPYYPQAPNKSIRLALLRAQEILGVHTETKIKLFVQPKSDDESPTLTCI